MDKSEAGRNILRLRQAKGWSQKRLADFAQVDRATIIRFEKGVIPRGENLAKIATALGVEISELFTKNIVPKPKKILADQPSSFALVGEIVSVLVKFDNLTLQRLRNIVIKVAADRRPAAASE